MGTLLYEDDQGAPEPLPVRYRLTYGSSGPLVVRCRSGETGMTRTEAEAERLRILVETPADVSEKIYPLLKRRV